MKSDTKKLENGSTHVPVILGCLAVVIVFAIGYSLYGHKDTAKPASVANDQSVRPSSFSDKKQSDQSQTGQWMERPGGPDSRWSYEAGTPPKCPDPIFTVSPTDTVKATSLLLPGQYRGSDYKAHGGFRFDDNQSGDLTVKLPLDAKLVGLKRYIEMDELQYLVDFENPCGVRVRFDHLATLSPELQKIADTTPAPTTDSRSDPHPELFGQAFKSGTAVATKVGFAKAHNFGFDFGVYDLRQVNEISKNDTWADLHRDKSGQTFYGVCWISWLPKADAARAASLLAQAPSNEKGASDYCDDAPGGLTLQYNAGKPLQ